MPEQPNYCTCCGKLMPDTNAAYYCSKECMEKVRKVKDGSPEIPLVKRATGRTIPDLTGREHVCEYQSRVRVSGERNGGKDV
jgi:hypothetical protein